MLPSPSLSCCRLLPALLVAVMLTIHQPTEAAASGPTPGSFWNLSAICGADNLYNFTATSWDHTCGLPGGAVTPEPQPRCRNFSNVVPSMTIGSDMYTDNATLLAILIHGGGPELRCGAERAPAGSCLAGTNAQPVGHRSIKLSGIDRTAMLDSPEDNILPGWNGTGWAPDAVCQPDIVAQEKGPYPGIWLD